MTLLVDQTTFTEYVRNGLGQVDEGHLLSSLTAADQAVKAVCRRDFAVAGAAATRLFVPPRGSQLLPIHDCTSVVSVTVDGTVVSPATLYQTEPVNLTSWDGLLRPIEAIRYVGSNWSVSSAGSATVAVAATWGWAAVPFGAIEAVKVLGKSLVEMRSSRSGLVAETVFGPVRLPREIAAQVMSILTAADLRRPEATVRMA